jgi:hypothetical protein
MMNNGQYGRKRGNNMPARSRMGHTLQGRILSAACRLCEFKKIYLYFEHQVHTMLSALTGIRMAFRMPVTRGEVPLEVFAGHAQILVHDRWL